jgi:hypothetical protein
MVKGNFNLLRAFLFLKIKIIHFSNNLNLGLDVNALSALAKKPTAIA